LHIFDPIVGDPAAPHRLVNRTRGRTLALRVEPAFDSQSRRRGLLGRTSLPVDSVLAIAPSNALHSFGMAFPIDLLFIRRDGVVVKRVVHLKPRRIAAALRAFAVLEFAADHPVVAVTQVGDVLGVEIASGAAST
jgi:uncharacterized membrane protein (UPF0127 family)